MAWGMLLSGCRPGRATDAAAACHGPACHGLNLVVQSKSTQWPWDGGAMVL